MQMQHVPVLGLPYWVAFGTIAVFGSNAGDLIVERFVTWDVERYRLPLLIVTFLAILRLEGRDRSARQSWYWLAAAIAPILSNDLAATAVAHFGLGRAWVFAGLVVALFVAVMAFQSDVTRLIAMRLLERPRPTPPLTDISYWIALVLASLAGTLASDYLTFTLGFNAREAVLALAVPLAAAIVFDGLRKTRHTFAYWTMVLVLNAFGTAAGRLLADDPRLGIGLPASVVVLGIVLAVVLPAVPNGAGHVRQTR